MKTEYKLYSKEDGLYFGDENTQIHGDFNKLLRRAKSLQTEMIVKAVKIKSIKRPLKILDATAGLGEDSFLLASAGHFVTLCEYDKIVFELLKDTVNRALNTEELKTAAEKMTLIFGSSIDFMKNCPGDFDVIYLDPMFPERQKTALVKKKFQVIHSIEKPCDNEEELLNAAINARPAKIVIKRPLKGPFLNNIKPGYSLFGKAIRYDCITPVSKDNGT